VREIAETVKGPVSAEAVSLEKDKLIEEARVIAKIDPNVVVKIRSVLMGWEQRKSFRKRVSGPM
jgi:transaldolase